ncbi:MAG: TAXI family TRAP transporter solute-binding subunit [Hyphomicrobiaceae bacterium]|nr:TAXI family TRAP transporter solute-binding subunit [Hyphomicrobiaceae bacterium]
MIYRNSRILGAIIGAMAFSTSCGAASAQDALVFAAGSPGSQSYEAATAMAKVFSDETSQETVVQSYGGLDTWLPLINSGEADFGEFVYEEGSDALEGKGRFAGNALTNVRMVGAIFPTSIGLFVKKDSEIKTMSDVKGHSVVYGYNAQPGIKEMIKGILASGGVTEADFQPVLVPSVGAGGDAAATGKADVGAFAYGSGKLIEIDNAVGGIRFLPIPEGEQAEAAMREFIPSSYVKTLMPIEGVVGVDEPTRMMTVDYVLVASADVPDETVYQLTKTLAEQLSTLAGINRKFADTTPETMSRKFSIPFHDGALRYYRDAGLLSEAQ